MNARALSSPAALSAAEKRREWLALLLVVALGASLFLPKLGERRFWYSYEARVAQVARQMLRASTFVAWLLPRLGDQDRLKKPPLAYWLAALASHAGGEVSHSTARFPNACAAMVCLIVVYAWGKSLYGIGAGLMAAAALATCGIFWQQGRSAGIEMPLLFFNLLALYAWWRYHHAPTPAAGGGQAAGRGWLLLAYAALSLAFLQKGPVGPILVMLIISVYLGVSGEWRQRGAGWRWHGLGILLFAALALPWYALVMYYKPEAWEIWLRESAGRIEGFDHLRHPSAYFVWQLLGNGQPWLAPALLSFFLLRRRRAGAMDKGILFTWVWSLTTLLFFSIPGSKKNYYLLPIYPALSLQAGMVFAAAASARDSVLATWLRRLLIAGGMAATAAGLLLLSLAPFFLLRRGLSPIYTTEPHFSLALAAIAALGIELLVCGWQRHFYAAAGGLTAAIAGAFAIYLTLVPAFDREKSQEPLAQALRPHLQPADEVCTYYHFAPEELMWYLDQPVKMLANPGEVQQAASAPRRGSFYLLADDRDLARFPGELRDAFAPLPHAALPGGLRWWRLRPDFFLPAANSVYN